uniref:Uncharacterized protein n=1 Tax=Oryza sativa subsp. japonica TaxID=39947 RepID=Q69V39_ORYSJ|nr:hypothetical protein [Oryza sativa Japonica Group]BAD35639.1 hypothetical protein [Oryza sativa Japonica Group]
MRSARGRVDPTVTPPNRCIPIRRRLCCRSSCCHRCYSTSMVAAAAASRGDSLGDAPMQWRAWVPPPPPPPPTVDASAASPLPALTPSVAQPPVVHRSPPNPRQALPAIVGISHYAAPPPRLAEPLCTSHCGRRKR